MEQITFAQQVHNVWIEPRLYGDYEYKQRKNWNSPNRMQRERANLLFSRVEQAIYNLANDIETNEILPTGTSNEYVTEISDDIGRIIFAIIVDDNNTINIVIKDFIWDYKNNTNSWWSIVETNTRHSKILIKESQLRRMIRETLRRVLLTA